MGVEDVNWAWVVFGKVLHHIGEKQKKGDDCG